MDRFGKRDFRAEYQNTVILAIQKEIFGVKENLEQM